MSMTSDSQLRQTLSAHLDAWVSHGGERRGADPCCSEGATIVTNGTAKNSLLPGPELRRDAADTVSAMAVAVSEIADLLSLGALAGPFGAATGRWSAVDPQRELDVLANTRVLDALAAAPVAMLVSEELDEPAMLPGKGVLAVAVDPLDGASNADTNAAIGTIFSVFLMPDRHPGEPILSGGHQLAAGFAVYGPQTVLVLTLGAGTHVFTLDPRRGEFVLTAAHVTIPVDAAEFAINAANHFHWDEPIRSYVDGCLKGADGPRAASHNMRWTGSFVAEVYRILVRGGVYLYPGDARPAYRNGRLRLAYEACPVAFIVEQAGGAASTGHQRILDVPVTAWHQRTPVIVGSRHEVEAVDRLHSDPFPLGERSPLFNRRGLFRV